jgi:hypothetical protein
MHTLTVGRTQCRRHARLSSATAINATAVYITAVIVTPELSSTRPTAAADDADDATAVAAHGCVAIVTSCVSPSLVYLGPTLRNWCPCLIAGSHTASRRHVRTSAVHTRPHHYLKRLTGNQKQKKKSAKTALQGHRTSGIARWLYVARMQPGPAYLKNLIVLKIKINKQTNRQTPHKPNRTINFPTAVLVKVSDAVPTLAVSGERLRARNTEGWNKILTRRWNRNSRLSGTTWCYWGTVDVALVCGQVRSQRPTRFSLVWV